LYGGLFGSAVEPAHRTVMHCSPKQMVMSPLGEVTTLNAGALGMPAPFAQ
jgi:hypothetical protein